MSDGTETPEAKKPAPSGNKLMMLIGLVNLLCVAGVGAYLVMAAKHAPASAKAPASHTGPAGEHAPAGHDDEPKEVGPIIALEPLVTNLADPDSDRYLKLTLQLRAASELARPEVEGSLVPIRSQILLFLSSLNVGDVSGSDKKHEIQKQLKRIANEAMPVSRITHVYFTEFVIQ